jgi:hypothetical protein
VPAGVARSLAVLFAVAVVLLVKSLPVLGPENVFRTTQSRLQIPVDTLFHRVAATRPQGALTARDVGLRAKFVNLESRLLYLQLGPDVVADCPFCAADDPRSYFYYAVPGLLAPHLVNLCMVALATSSLLTGGGVDGDATVRRWRTPATIAAAILCALDIYLVNAYDYQANSRALRLAELDHFFWSARAYRCLALAALDALLGWLLWLSSTNRAFVRPPHAAERVEGLNRAIAAVRSKMSALGIVKNTAIRDDELRTRSHAYWMHEVRLMGEVMEEREVIEGVNDALQNRIDIRTISSDAETYADGVLQMLQPLQPTPAPSSGDSSTAGHAKSD